MRRNKEWEQWALITADRHLDNPHSNRSMQRRHLDQARERGAFVLDLGDLFCAMQGRSDPRHCKCDLDTKHKSNDYLGEIIRDAAEFFRPYGENLAMLGLGNHETKIAKHMELDLTRALVDLLRAGGSPVIRGGYRGWVRLMFEAKGGGRQSLVIAYTHGSGGASPVTKGVIKTNRRAVIYPDANIVLGGHIHEGWSMPICRVRMNDSGREFSDIQLHLSVPTYKEEIIGAGEGWATENEHNPKPLGAWWLRFFWDYMENRVKFEPMMAA